MKTIEMKVTGLKEFERSIKNMDITTKRKLKFYFNQFLDKVRSLAVLKVPVITGHLQSSIDTEMIEKKGTLEGYIGSNVFYAPFVELGTSRSRPKPYLLPAFKEMLPKLVGILKKAFK